MAPQDAGDRGRGEAALAEQTEVYLSAKVIWRYVMAGFFLLEENRRLPSARSPISLGDPVALTI